MQGAIAGDEGRFYRGPSPQPSPKGRGGVSPSPPGRRVGDRQASPWMGEVERCREQAPRWREVEQRREQLPG